VIWGLFALGVVVLAILGAAVVGFLIPADHVAARAATIRGAPDAVFAALVDVDAFPTWRPDVKKVERLPAQGGRPSWREHTGFGPIAVAQDEADHPRRLVVRIADPDLPFGGTWTYELSPAPGGTTRLTITERGTVKNVLFRFLSRFVFGYTRTIDAYLGALGKKFGEDAKIDSAD
jgi:uncharacterized protein YndB with AHSA1/START domain